MSADGEPINVADYERLASEVLDPGALGYFAGGAADERTLRENVAALARWRLRPRVLVDVAEVSTRTTVLGEAIEAGFRAVALTVDAPRPGRRERDLRSGFRLPSELSVPSVVEATGARDPISVADVLRLVDPALGWADLEALVADSSLPIL